MIKVLNWADQIRFACRGAGRWGLHLSFPACEDAESEPAQAVLSAAPILKELTYSYKFSVLLDGKALLLFDDKQSATAAFGAVVGDDGPTETNPYDGPGRVYALLCDPNGNCITENT